MPRFPLWIAVAYLTMAPLAAEAQLRIVSYNTLDKPSDATDDAQFDEIFAAIAATDANGIAKRVDILALQEQTRGLVDGDIFDTSENIAARLNSLHGVSSYESSMIGSGGDRVAIVYDTSTVDLLSAASVDLLAGRPAQVARFRPVGYTSPDSEFYLYDVHLDAGSSSTRASQVTNMLADSSALVTSLDAAGSASNIIYLGDFNFQSSSESGYTNLTGAGIADAIDPIDVAGQSSTGAWPHSSVAEHMTQSTRLASLADGGASSGMDDRFDFQLLTEDLFDGEGVSYLGPTTTGLSALDHSYQAFGNDGVSWDNNINNTYAGRSQSAAVIDALYDFSDHLPVVADYQLPAVLDVVTDAIPDFLAVGSPFELTVTIANAADVAAAVGADELEYDLTTTLDLSGTFSGVEAALGAGAVHLVGFDTSTLGLKSGVIRIETDSLGAANSLIEIPVSYEVVTAPDGDFNEDLIVDAADYATWRNGLGVEYTAADYDIWRANYGATPGSAASAPPAGVPEPGAIVLTLLASAGMLLRRRF